jgi:hypothetical protein
VEPHFADQLHSGSTSDFFVNTEIKPLSVPYRIIGFISFLWSEKIEIAGSMRPALDLAREY